METMVFQLREGKGDLWEIARNVGARAAEAPWSTPDSSQTSLTIWEQ